MEVIACYLQEYMRADLTLTTGTRSRVCAISVYSVCEQLRLEMCWALSGLYALTGCDTKHFRRIGEKVALERVKNAKERRASIFSVGDSVQPSNENLRRTVKFVCALYNDVNSCSVSETRYKLFSKNQKLLTVKPASSHPCRLRETSQACHLSSLHLETRTGGKNPPPTTRR